MHSTGILNTPLTLDTPVISVGKTAVQTYTGGVLTKVTFDSNDILIQNRDWNYAVSRFEPSQDGVYLLSPMIVSSSATAMSKLVQVYVNGSLDHTVYADYSNGDFNGPTMTGIPVQMTVGDYAELYATFGVSANFTTACTLVIRRLQ